LNLALPVRDLANSTTNNFLRLVDCHIGTHSSESQDDKTDDVVGLDLVLSHDFLSNRFHYRLRKLRE